MPSGGYKVLLVLIRGANHNYAYMNTVMSTTQFENLYFLLNKKAVILLQDKRKQTGC